jgi:hypothetical protein
LKLTIADSIADRQFNRRSPIQSPIADSQSAVDNRQIGSRRSAVANV